MKKRTSITHELGGTNKINPSHGAASAPTPDTGRLTITTQWQLEGFTTSTIATAGSKKKSKAKRNNQRLVPAPRAARPEATATSTWSDSQTAAPESLTAISRMNLQTNCPIFRLPQELRDIIYKYVITTKTPSCYVDINDAELATPKADLVLTCHRVWYEALPIHEAAYAAYWSKHIFTIHIPDSNAKFQGFEVNRQVFTRKRLENITRITIHADEYYLTGLALQKEAGSRAWDLVRVTGCNLGGRLQKWYEAFDRLLAATLQDFGLPDYDDLGKVQRLRS